MFASLIVIPIESWIKKKKKNIRAFLVSIDYYEYFEVISTISFLSRFYIFLVLHYIFKTSPKK